jgi:hypothetical protein
MYATHAKQLFGASPGEQKVAIIRDLHSKISAGQRLPTLDQFVAAFAQVRYSRLFTQQTRLVGYILRHLHAHHVAMPPDFVEMTIEHIAPQAGVPGMPDIAALDVAKLGNLIYVPKALNQKLGTKTFAAKREILQDAADNGLWVDPFILNASNWTATEINERTRELAKVSYEKVWSLTTVRP